jgi:hypothetical protein
VVPPVSACGVDTVSFAYRPERESVFEASDG